MGSPFCGTIQRLVLRAGLWAVYGVKRAPQRVERVIRGSHDPLGITVGVFLKPIAPRRAVSLVGFFVHGEVSQSLRISDAVEALQSFNFCRGNFWNLGFVSVQSGNRFRDRTISANFAIGLYYRLRAGKRRAAGDVVFRNTQRDRKIAP